MNQNKNSKTVQLEKDGSAGFSHILRSFGDRHGGQCLQEGGDTCRANKVADKEWESRAFELLK